MFELIASLVIRRGWWIVLAWVVTAVLLKSIAPGWETVSRDDDVRFFPAGYPSVIGQDLLERGFPKDASGSVAVLIAERQGAKLTTRDFLYIDEISDALKALAQQPLTEIIPEFSARLGKNSTFVNELNDLKVMANGLGLKQVTDHRALVIGPRLIGTAKDGKSQAALTLVSMTGTYQSKQTRVAVNVLNDFIERFQAGPDGLKLGMTGSAAVGHDMNAASNSSMDKTTKATILLVVVILLVVYRSPLLALIPLVTIALSILVSIWTIAALTKIPGLDIQVINITKIFVIVVLFGAGTDYCLFLIARYREELVHGRDGLDALSHAITSVGGALVASAGTVICGLGMLWFSTFAKIQYTGPAIALSLFIGLVASLTLAPVLLRWLRNAVFWPFKPPHHELGADMETESVEQMPLSGFWTWVADLVVKRPAMILIVSLVALTPLAIVGAKTKSNYSQLADLGADQPSVIGARMIQAYFPLGELGPTAVLISHPTLNFRSDAGREAIELLCQKLETIPGVAEVRSVARPLGKKEKPIESINFAQRAARIFLRRGADPRYVSIDAEATADVDHITKLDLVMKFDPFSEEALGVLKDVQHSVATSFRDGGPLQGATATGQVGSTPLIDDLKAVITLDQRRMYILVTGGVYLILLVLLRRPGICLYLIATVLLGYLASLGLTELVFKALHTGPDPWVGLDWKVGFFLFVILVAVGEDYNIFLMARVLEEEKKYGVIEGTRRAVAHTGGIISSCGLIMAGTFGSMLSGSLNALRELGFALALGVLLDTFIVRPILVPAFVILLERLPHKIKQRSTTLTEVEHAPVS